jgi:tetratricopeptide (TPR) repeat protein
MQNLAIQQKVAGAYSPALRSTIALLGALYLTQERWAEAEPFYLLGVEIAQRSGDAKMQAFANNALALLYRRQRRYVEAEQLYVQALNLIERNYGPDDPSLAGILQMYGILLTATHRYDEAARINARMNELKNKSTTRTP